MAVEENVIISFREGNSDFEKAIERIDKRLSSIEKKFDDVDDSIEDTNKSTKDLNTSLNSTEKNINKVEKSGSKLESTFKKAAVAFAATFAVAQINRFISGSTRAADVQLKAEAKLLTALKGREDIQKSLIRQAQDLQQQTLFGDEETIEAQARLASVLGQDEEAIKRLIPLVQDFATKQQVDLATAADLVGKSVGTSTNALTRYGIQIEGAVGSNERLSSAVNELTRQVGGQAEAARKAGAGALTSLVNIYGDLREEIGKVILKAAVPLAEALSTLLLTLIRLPEFIRQNRTELALLGTALVGLRLNAIVSSLQTLGIAFISYTRLIAASTAGTNLFTAAFRRLSVAIRANPFGAALTAISLLAAGLFNLQKRANGAGKEIGKLGDEIDDLSKIDGSDVFKRIQTSLDEVGIKIFTVGDLVENFDKVLDKITFKELQALEEFLSGKLKDATEEAENAMTRYVQNAADEDVANLNKALATVRDRMSEIKSGTIEAEQELDKLDETIKSFAVGSLLDLQSKFEANEAAIKSFQEELAGIDPNDAAGIDAIKEKISELTKTNFELEQSILSLSEKLLNNFVDGSLSDLEAQVEVTEDAISLLNEEINNTTEPAELKVLKARYDELTSSVNTLKEAIVALNIENRKTLGLLETQDPLAPIKASTIEQSKNQDELNLKYRETISLQQQLAIDAENSAKKQEENKEKALSAINAVGQTSADVFDLTTSIFQNRLAQDEELYRKGLISEKELARRKAEIAQKQFKAQKAQTLVEISLSIAQGIAAAIAASPLTGGLPFTAIVASLGAAQLAIAAAQKPPPIPAFKHGVINLQGKGTSTSDSIDAKLSRGESVMTAKETQRHMIALEAMRANNFHDRFIDLKNIKPSDYKNIINSTDIIKPFNVLKSESKPVNIVNKLNNKDLIQNTNNNFNKQNYLLKSVKMSIDELNKNINQKSASSYAV